jgi:hypothetical protein
VFPPISKNDALDVDACSEERLFAALRRLNPSSLLPLSLSHLQSSSPEAPIDFRTCGSTYLLLHR